jgi:hypothetical protein
MVIDRKTTIQQTLKTFQDSRNMALKFPFWVRLAENPKYSIFNRNIIFIPGAVSELIHDVIHIMLGRGFLPEDEAFVIGFTFGSTKKWNCMGKIVYRFASKYCYPDFYKFNDEQLLILELGVQAGEQLTQTNLSKISYSEVKEMTIDELRYKYIIDWDALFDFYKKEVEIFSSCPAHARLAAIKI